MLDTSPTSDTAPLVPDADVQAQHKLLDALHASPYFNGFEPRAYSLYVDRHYNPVAYLEQVGIEKIAELLQHGFFQQEICALLGISTRVFTRWIAASAERMKELESARRFAADSSVMTARHVLEDASVFPDTARAKALADHHQWCAERWDKDMYGTKQLKVDATVTNGISYEFNINVRAKAPEVLEGVYTEVAKLPLPDGALQELVEAVTRPSLDFSEAEGEEGEANA